MDGDGRDMDVDMDIHTDTDSNAEIRDSDVEPSARATLEEKGFVNGRGGSGQTITNSCVKYALPGEAVREGYFPVASVFIVLLPGDLNLKGEYYSWRSWLLRCE